MSTSWNDVGSALTALVQAVDITGVVPGGWVEVANYPIKIATNWPVAAIVPAESTDMELDIVNDEADLIWWILVLYSYNDAASAEAKVRQIADLLVTAIRDQKMGRPPLGLPAVFAFGDIRQTWGMDDTYGTRYYRLAVTVKVNEPLT